MKLFKTTYFVYILILFLAVFGGGSIIKLYGDTCGLSIFQPTSWLSSMILIGSPWCKGLNWLGHISTNIIENIWYHLVLGAIGYVYNYIPSPINFNNIDSRSSKIVFSNSNPKNEIINKKLD